MKTSIEFFKDEDDGQWRWSMDRGGHIVAESGEYYSKLASAKKSLRNLINVIREEAVKVTTRHDEDTVEVGDLDTFDAPGTGKPIKAKSAGKPAYQSGVPKNSEHVDDTETCS